MEIHVRFQFDDERLLPLVYRVIDLLKPRGLSGADEDRVYRALKQAVERAEGAATS